MVTRQGELGRSPGGGVLGGHCLILLIQLLGFSQLDETGGGQRGVALKKGKGLGQGDTEENSHRLAGRQPVDTCRNGELDRVGPGG